MDYYEGLSEDSPIGGLFSLDATTTIVPFICREQRFLASFTSITGADYEQAIRNIVLVQTGRPISNNAYSVKYGHVEHFLTARNQFDPAPLDAAVRRSLLYQIPKRVFESAVKVCEETHADELYFVPGGGDEERVQKLSLWYTRISDRFASTFSPQSAGFTHIHTAESQGEWYGFRKI